MNNTPLISVIVPVYNSENYLDRCIKSIVEQTYTNIEVILVNDGSKDSSPAICDKWALQDSRITVIHKQNEGDHKARNCGIEIAKGEYVIMIDNDDYMEPDMLEFLLNLIVEHNADISRCGFWFEHESDGSQICASNDTSVKIFDYNQRMIDLLMSNHISGVIWNKLYKTSFLKKYSLQEMDGASDDILFNYRMCLDNPVTVYCDIPKHHYVIRKESMTNSKFGYGAFDIIRAKNIFLDKFKDNEEVYPYAIKSYIISAFIVMTGCLRNNACMDRYDELRNGILIHKDFVKNSPLFSKQEKFKVWLLGFSKTLYNLMIKIKHS